MPSQDRRFPTWKWIAVTAVGAAGTLVLLAFADTKRDIGKLQDEKLDRQEYYKDYREMNERLKKIDDIYEYLLEHRHATERR